MGRTRNQPEQRMMIGNESFAGSLEDGTPFVVVKEQTRVWSDHEIVRRWPHLFKPISAHYGIEAATAGPGEERP